MPNENPGFYKITKRVRMLFPNLIEPKPYKNKAGKEQGDPKYNALYLFPADHPDLEPMKKLAIKLAREQWPGIQLNEVKWPFKQGDVAAQKREAAGKNGDLYKGMTTLKAGSTFPVTLDGVENGKPVTYGEDSKALAKAKFYSGVYTLVQVTFKPMEIEDTKRVVCYLNRVFSFGTGDKIGGGPSAAEAWSGHIGQETAEDPTAGQELDDEIPF